MEETATVFVVDDDVSARELIAEVIRARGWSTITYGSAEEFLEGFDRAALGCLLADLRMSGMSGLELLERLKQEGCLLPVVILTGFGDIPTAVNAMRSGALTFLEKPCSEPDLWEAVEGAIQSHRGRRERQARRDDLAARFAILTRDEAQVLDCILAGKPNKTIASELSIGLRTVELRRANIMKKVRVDSLAELVRLTLEFRESPPAADE